MVNSRSCRVLSKKVRVVGLPEVRDLAEELVAIGRIGTSEGKVLIDTGAQVSMIKRDAAPTNIQKTDVILEGISGRILKIYGKQDVFLQLKPGVQVPGTYIVSNLLRGYLAVIGCAILNAGAGKIYLERGSLILFGREIWLNRLRKSESVPDPSRAKAPSHELDEVYLGEWDERNSQM